MPRRLAAPASGHPRAAAVRPRREHAPARHAWLSSTHLLPIRVDHAARALTPSTGLTNGRVRVVGRFAIGRHVTWKSASVNRQSLPAVVESSGSAVYCDLLGNGS